ncbi:MAG: hypothetical protein IJA25_07560 [Anaerotignum sp.]|nr:hypothetical protein [Anaerotignum sp.]
MGETLLFSIVRTAGRLSRINEADPTATPYVVGYVVVLWAMVFLVKWFTNRINRK